MVLHGTPYTTSVAENTNANNTLTFLAAAFHCGRESIAM
jgi:hypothetical protein